MPNYPLILITNYPNTQWTFDGFDYSGLNWLDSSPKPTKEQLDSQWQPLLDSITTSVYKEQRAKQYPSVTDQLDMLWHAINTGSLDKTSEFYTTLKAIKDNNPK
jgi:hypothetical protein